MKFTITLTWLFIFSFSVFSQLSENIWKVEDGWKGLIPFQSTKADAEKVLGKGVRTKWARGFQYEYDTTDAIVLVDYTPMPCEEIPETHLRFDIPEDTIFQYEVRLKRLTSITKFTFDKNRFERDISRSQNNEPLPYFSYRQFKEDLWKVLNEWSAGIGITFWGDVIQDTDYVKGFDYGPSHNDLEKYRCDKTDSQQPSVKNNEL